MWYFLRSHLLMTVGRPLSRQQGGQKRNAREAATPERITMESLSHKSQLSNKTKWVRPRAGSISTSSPASDHYSEDHKWKSSQPYPKQRCCLYPALDSWEGKSHWLEEYDGGRKNQQMGACDNPSAGLEFLNPFPHLPEPEKSHNVDRHDTE